MQSAVFVISVPRLRPLIGVKDSDGFCDCICCLILISNNIYLLSQAAHLKLSQGHGKKLQNYKSTTQNKDYLLLSYAIECLDDIGSDLVFFRAHSLFWV